MLGSIGTRDHTLETVGEEYLEAAEDELDISFTELFDSVEATSLPEHVPAAMRHKKHGYLYDRVELLLDDEFKDLYSNEKLNAMIHEGVHGLAAQGKLDDVLIGKGIPSEEARRIDTLIEEETEAVMEGIVQSIADALDPDEGGRYFRPTERYMAQTVLQREGIDLEAEIEGVALERAEWYGQNDVYDVETGLSLYDDGDLPGLDDVWSPGYEGEAGYAGADPVYDPGQYAS